MATIPQAEVRSMRAPAEPRGAAPRVVLPHSLRHRQARATPADRRGAAQPARAEEPARAGCRLVDANAPPWSTTNARRLRRADCV